MKLTAKPKWNQFASDVDEVRLLQYLLFFLGIYKYDLSYLRRIDLVNIQIISKNPVYLFCSSHFDLIFLNMIQCGRLQKKLLEKMKKRLTVQMVSMVDAPITATLNW